MPTLRISSPRGRWFKNVVANLLLFVALFLAVAGVQGQSPVQGSRAAEAREAFGQLRAATPDPESDFNIADVRGIPGVSTVRTAKGRAVRISGLPKSSHGFFYAIDSVSNTYAIFRLTGDADADAQRIQGYLVRRGRPVPHDRLRLALTKVGLRGPALGRASQAPLDPEIAKNEIGSKGGPRDAGGKPGGGGRQYYVCMGSMQAWVAHFDPLLIELARTEIYTPWYLGYNSGYFVQMMGGVSCWANANTGFSTWYAVNCGPEQIYRMWFQEEEPTGYGPNILATGAGEYWNEDFPPLLPWPGETGIYHDMRSQLIGYEGYAGFQFYDWGQLDELIFGTGDFWGSDTCPY